MFHRRTPASIILNAALDARKVRTFAVSADYHAVSSVLILSGKRSAVELANRIATEYAYVRQTWTAA